MLKLLPPTTNKVKLNTNPYINKHISEAIISTVDQYIAADKKTL